MRVTPIIHKKGFDLNRYFIVKLETIYTKIVSIPYAK